MISLRDMYEGFYGKESLQQLIRGTEQADVSALLACFNATYTGQSQRSGKAISEPELFTDPVPTFQRGERQGG